MTVVLSALSTLNGSQPEVRHVVVGVTVVGGPERVADPRSSAPVGLDGCAPPRWSRFTVPAPMPVPSQVPLVKNVKVTLPVGVARTGADTVAESCTIVPERHRRAVGDHVVVGVVADAVTVVVLALPTLNGSQPEVATRCSWCRRCRWPGTSSWPAASAPVGFDGCATPLVSATTVPAPTPVPSQVPLEKNVKVTSPSASSVHPTRWPSRARSCPTAPTSRWGSRCGWRRCAIVVTVVVLALSTLNGSQPDGGDAL